MDWTELRKEALVFKALAHPSRLAVAEALAAGARCVCELHEIVGGDMSTVSRHLSVLKGAGVIADEKKGQWVYYHLTLPCVTTFLSCLRHPAETSECAAASTTPAATCRRQAVRR
ncbi:MAG TPA: metalloregulator ArsR/SmtB family transcription factor [Acidobacteriota bacterium]|jgi:ArsR family transcriptional regulator|nr:helix-turn-helix transcriptional regulator [Acidobacteriota bacterium]HNR38622.1 metalloregulator ArsR/SmtB family transcription factor [Acidobacteriota bacterium]HNU01180.1 metalloregulator ArsR/SmtB family transcription factor [Acidobacteriota bacterium]HPB28044.1 metalloregulator ArsR/SmtB family transcription factor [Acidobacteriota bacterium]HQO25265.1 metalloregulator ArsR/SmtB family transcription factor [Acidobacteriota bacterium]